MKVPFNQLNSTQQAKVLEHVMTALYSGQDHDSSMVSILVFMELVEIGESDFDVDNIMAMMSEYDLVQSILYVINNPSMVPHIRKALFSPEPGDYEYIASQALY